MLRLGALTLSQIASLTLPFSVTNIEGGGGGGRGGSATGKCNVKVIFSLIVFLPSSVSQLFLSFIVA